MGTPDFAVPCLKALIESEHEVAAVFTKPDKKKGRGHQLACTPIKTVAVDAQIPVYQPVTLKGEEAEGLIKQLAPDIIIVVAYGRILPRSILNMPKYGCVNVHASLLPKYRGAGPIQWSVLNGEKVTGVTTMYMAEGIDTGDMLLKAELEIGINETASELHDRLSEIGAPLLIKTIEGLQSGSLERIRQNEAESCHAPMLTKEMCSIDFSKAAVEVHNQIRGLSEWPCAETTINKKRLKVYKSELAECSTGAAGEVVDNKGFIVCCGDGKGVRLAEVQYEGSKRMSGSDFLRGHRIENGEKLGQCGDNNE